MSAGVKGKDGPLPSPGRIKAAFPAAVVQRKPSKPKHSPHKVGAGEKMGKQNISPRNKCTKKKNLNNGFETRAGEMTTWLTALASKSHGQSLTPRPHVVKRKKQPHQSVLYLLHSCHGIRACVYAHAHTQLVDIFLEI